MGYVVFNVNYPLAPIHKMDDILASCCIVCKKVKEIAGQFGGDASKIVLACDSFGAHISASIFREVEDVKALLLYYGVYDLNTLLDSGFKKAKIYIEAALKGNGKDIE